MIRIFRLTLLLLAFQLPASAQSCPGPQRLLVGLSPGGGMDVVARLLAQRLTATFGGAMVVENKTGATGNIAAEFAARAPKDGCTLIIRGNEHNVNPVIYARAGYEPKDFASVVRAVSGPAVILTGPNQPFRTLAEMVDYAKTHPGKLSYGSSGIGGANHIAMELFLKVAKINVVHVPYKGAAPAITDTAGGLVPLVVGSVAAALPFIDNGQLRPLAVTGPRRWPSLPGVPTLTEAGYAGATYVYWMGILAPAGTPLPLRERLNQQLRAILDEAPVRERLLTLGYETAGGSIEDFSRFLQDDERLSRRLIQELQIKID